MGYLKREDVRVVQKQAKILYENGVISKEKYEAECKQKVQVVRFLNELLKVLSSLIST